MISYCLTYDCQFQIYLPLCGNQSYRLIFSGDAICQPAKDASDWIRLDYLINGNLTQPTINQLSPHV